MPAAHPDLPGMVHLFKTVFLASMLLAATTVVGSGAFTAASVDRSATTDVVTDDGGLVGLTDGNSGPLVFQNADGQLEIDVTNGTAQGLTSGATFELGDPENPGETQAFTIRNNDAEEHDMTVAYTLDSDDSTDSENVKFRIFDSNAQEVATVTEEGSGETITATAGQSFNVVVIYDTTDSQTSDDLSGTLSIDIDDVAE